jgi:predicted nucleic acid-binding protein
MAELIFTDASAWIALIYTKDSYHQQASATYRSLVDKGCPLIVTNWVAYEALSFVRSRAGYAVTVALNQILHNQQLVWWEQVTPAIEEQAVQMFWRYEDKTWGIVDCASLVVMQLLGCQRAFGYDHHFVEAARQSGFHLLGDDLPPHFLKTLSS